MPGALPPWLRPRPPGAFSASPPTHHDPALSGSATRPDTPFVNLLGSLSPGAPLVLRLGGNSADDSWSATPHEEAAVASRAHPRWASDVRALLKALGGKAILGVDLEEDARVAGAQRQGRVRSPGPSTRRCDPDTLPLSTLPRPVLFLRAVLSAGRMGQCSPVGIMRSTMDFDLGLLEALNRVAVESVAAGRLPAEAVLPGVRALDLWSEGPNGAMLLWVDRGRMASASPNSTTSSLRVSMERGGYGRCQLHHGTVG